MIDRFTVEMDSFSYPERKAYVYVPNSFKKDPDRRYPVLYMFDGQNVFFNSEATYGKAWCIHKFLQKAKTQLMVVAIESNGSPNFDRLSEYSPFDFEDENFGFVKGQADKTLEWFVNELKPFIDDNYPTLPQRETTFVAGSSMGGLLAYHFLFAANDVFSKAACLSPSFWVDPEGLKQEAKNCELNDGSLIYLDYGSLEVDGRFGVKAYKAFWKVVNTLKRKDIDLTVREIRGGTHCEAHWEKQIPVFINILMQENS